MSSGRFLFRWAEAGEEAGVFCDLSQDGAQSSTWKPSSFILRRLSERSGEVWPWYHCCSCTSWGWVPSWSHGPLTSELMKEASSHCKVGPLRYLHAQGKGSLAKCEDSFVLWNVVNLVPLPSEIWHWGQADFCFFLDNLLCGVSHPPLPQPEGLQNCFFIFIILNSCQKTSRSRAYVGSLSSPHRVLLFSFFGMMFSSSLPFSFLSPLLLFAVQTLFYF